MNKPSTALEKQSGFQSKMKGLNAVLTAGYTFLPYATLGYTALFPRIFRPGRPLPDIYRHVAKNCARKITERSLEGILGIRQEIVGTIPETFPEEERTVYLANHPTNNGLPALMNFVTEHFADHFMAISKRENLWHPTAALNFWPLWMMDSMIFIDRQGGNRTIEQIRQSTRSKLTNNSGLLIFPDSRRPTQSAIMESIEKHGPLDIPADQPQYTRAPRRGGLHTIMQALHEFRTRYLSITLGFDRQDETLADAGRLQGATLRFKVDDVTEDLTDPQIAGNPNALGEWLNQDWVEKNKLLHQWRQPPLALVSDPVQNADT